MTKNYLIKVLLLLLLLFASVVLLQYFGSLDMLFV